MDTPFTEIIVKPRTQRSDEKGYTIIPSSYQAGEVVEIVYGEDGLVYTVRVPGEVLEERYFSA